MKNTICLSLVCSMVLSACKTEEDKRVQNKQVSAVSTSEANLKDAIMDIEEMLGRHVSSDAIQKLKVLCDGGPLDEKSKSDIFHTIGGCLSSKDISEEKSKSITTLVRFIYAKRFDINKIYSAGIYNNTILMWEISYGKAINQKFTLMLLDEFKANPFITDKFSKNALHFLLLKGHKEQQYVIDKVLAHPDLERHINDQTIHGDTALHIACVRRDLQNIRRLLQKGADPNIKNKEGKRPTDLLDMHEGERIYFLSQDQYLHIYGSGNPDLEYVATIDYTIFNSDPSIIKNEINTFVQRKELNN